MNTAARALALFDLDGTITRRDTFGPFLAACLRQYPARLPRFGAVLPAAVVRYLYTRRRGQLKGTLIHAALGGLTRAQLAAPTAQFVSQLLRHGLFAEALERIQIHRAQADRLVLLSASPDLYVPQIGAALGFDETVCSEVRWHPDGRLDGHLSTPNRRGEEKLRCVQALIARWAPTRVYAYGNSRADLAHMRCADEAGYINVRHPPSDIDLTHVRVLRWRQRGAAASQPDKPVPEE